MGNGSGVSRGGRNRNARLERLRVLVPVTNAITGIDLAEIRQPDGVDSETHNLTPRRMATGWCLSS